MALGKEKTRARWQGEVVAKVLEGVDGEEGEEGLRRSDAGVRA